MLMEVLARSSLEIEASSHSFSSSASSSASSTSTSRQEAIDEEAIDKAGNLGDYFVEETPSFEDVFG